MPANLPPAYYAAEKRLREVGSPQEKIDILREMLAIMPKHKGTEHLQGDLKRRIAKLNTQSQKKGGTSRSSGLDHIPCEGAGQVVLVGAPNTGKSTLLNKMTHAHSDTAVYPFSTFRPVQGMMPYEDIQIQLVDLPPVSDEYKEMWLFNIIRLADLILLFADLSVSDPVQQVQKVREILENHKIILKENGFSRPQGATAEKSTLLMGSKADVQGARDAAENLQNTYRDELPLMFTSLKTGSNVDALREVIFQRLHVIRVYTKMPGRKADLEKPYILPEGTTVFDAACSIHKDMAKSMKFARLWGSNKYDGQRVERDHVLEDKDVVEIHTR